MRSFKKIMSEPFVASRRVCFVVKRRDLKKEPIHEKIIYPLVLTASVLCMPIASFQPDAPLRLRFVGNAEAIIGMPWTPLSFAGVARRTMYREAAWNAAAYNVAATNAATANMAYANAYAAQTAAANANAAAAQAAAANAQAAAAAAQTSCRFLADWFNGAVPAA